MKKLLLIGGMWVFVTVLWAGVITGIYFLANHAGGAQGIEHGLCVRFLSMAGSASVVVAALASTVAYHITKCLVSDK